MPSRFLRMPQYIPCPADLAPGEGASLLEEAYDKMVGVYTFEVAIDTSGDEDKFLLRRYRPAFRGEENGAGPVTVSGFYEGAYGTLVYFDVKAGRARAESKVAAGVIEVGAQTFERIRDNDDEEDLDLDRAVVWETSAITRGEASELLSRLVAERDAAVIGLGVANERIGLLLAADREASDVIAQLRAEVADYRRMVAAIEAENSEMRERLEYVDALAMDA